MASTLSPRASSEPPLWSWRVAFSIGFFTLWTGLSFLAFPTHSAVMWGFPPPTTSTHRAFLGLLGTRDLYLACSVLLFWLRGEKRVVGWLLLLGGAVPAADGCVALWNAAPALRVALHWAATALCTVVGYSLVA